MRKVEFLVAEITNENLSTQGNDRVTIQHDAVRECPWQGTNKINVHAAYKLGDLGATTAAVLQNSEGLVLFASSAFHLHVDSGLYGEYVVVLTGLQMIKAGGFTCVEVETNSQIVVNDILKGVNSISR